MRPGNDVALNILELRLRLVHGELLVSARLLKHLPARCDAAKTAAWRHSFDIGIEQLFGRVQVMRDDGLYELARAGELHRRNLVSANAIFKLAPSQTRRCSPPVAFPHTGHGRPRRLPPRGLRSGCQPEGPE
jgi:hypothetical protein